jgi:hypothetical protein
MPNYYLYLSGPVLVPVRSFVTCLINSEPVSKSTTHFKVLIILDMMFAKTGKNMMFAKAVLALALVAANTNLFVKACDDHGHHHHQLENGNDTDLCDEDSPNGLSYEIDGRRTQSRFRVGSYDWGTQKAFVAAGARCVSHEPSPRQVRTYNDIKDDYMRRIGSNRRLAAAKQIPVYFHIIKPSNGSGGEVSDAQIKEQIAVLNAAFEGVFEFTESGIDYTQRNSYYTAPHDTAAESQMKTSLRKGGANALNIYTTSPVRKAGNPRETAHLLLIAPS